MFFSPQPPKKLRLCKAHFEQAHNVTSPQPERGKKKKKRRKPKVFGGSDGGGDGAGGDADELQQAKKPIVWPVNSSQ